MMLLRYTGAYLLYLGLQVLLFNHLTLFDLALAHVFLVFLLMLPLSLPFSAAILIGFFSGLVVDLFSYNMIKGVHAFSCVLMMAVRGPWTFLISNRAAYRDGEEFELHQQSPWWFFTYLLPLILLHQFSYYMLEVFDVTRMGLVLMKTGLSTAFTFIWVYVLTLLFYRRTRR